MIHPSLPKLASFCVYQERSRTEIQEKMQALEIPVEVQPKIWEYLEREEYFNEGRFAAAFVGGKFRQLRWGRKKILYEIQKHRVSGAIIEAAIQSEISEEAYTEAIQEIISKKQKEFKKHDIIDQKAKITRFLIAKGYEWEVFKSFIADYS